MEAVLQILFRLFGIAIRIASLNRNWYWIVDCEKVQSICNQIGVTPAKESPSLFVVADESLPTEVLSLVVYAV